MPDKEKAAGWGFPTAAARKEHWWAAGQDRSGCGRYGRLMVRTEERPPAEEFTCAACERKARLAGALPPVKARALLCHGNGDTVEEVLQAPDAAVLRVEVMSWGDAGCEKRGCSVPVTRSDFQTGTC